jgi:hypothetical protein
MNRLSIALLMLTIGLILRMAKSSPAAPTPATTQADGQHVPLSFEGGYDTDPRDRGRPVVLVGNALGVTPEVFRDAFSGVHPAGPNSGGPSDAEARANKKVLMDKLAPYGVTDQRLNEVSNYYRYRRNNGELWKHRPAAGYAVVQDGAVKSVTITDAGAGYTTPPTATIASAPGATFTVTLSFGTDLKTNGSIKSVTIDPPPPTTPSSTQPSDAGRLIDH